MGNKTIMKFCFQYCHCISKRKSTEKRLRGSRFLPKGINPTEKVFEQLPKENQRKIPWPFLREDYANIMEEKKDKTSINEGN